MIGFSAFKTRKPRSFDYRPRFYNAEAEAREVRKRELLGDQPKDPNQTPGTETKPYKPGQYIGEMRMRTGIIANRQHEKQKANMIRVVIFVVAMLALVWYIFS